MNIELPADVADQIELHVRSGAFRSHEEVLREALGALAEREADLAAIRDGIADMEAGRVTPLDKADADIRQRLGLTDSD